MCEKICETPYQGDIYIYNILRNERNWKTGNCFLYSFAICLKCWTIRTLKDIGLTQGLFKRLKHFTEKEMHFILQALWGAHEVSQHERNKAITTIRIDRTVDSSKHL